MVPLTFTVISSVLVCAVPCGALSLLNVKCSALATSETDSHLLLNLFDNTLLYGGIYLTELALGYTDRNKGPSGFCAIARLVSTGSYRSIILLPSVSKNITCSICSCPFNTNAVPLGIVKSAPAFIRMIITDHRLSRTGFRQD
jgi:hypothetical protein